MLKRNPAFILNNLYEKNNKIYTKKKATIEIPKTFENKNLFTIEKNVIIYGIFALIMDDYYSVSVIPTTLVTNPLSITESEINGEEYYVLIYGEDTPIIEEKIIVKNKLLSYNLFDLFFSLGKIPWYIEYEDVLRILDNLPVYADSNIGDNYISNEILTSFITRLKKDPKIYLRLVDEFTKEDYIYVDLENVYYSVFSTTNKIAGAYFSEGLISALVEKEKEPTKLENLVRK